MISSESIKAECNICQPYAETLAFDHVICQSMQPFDGIGEQFDMVTFQENDPSISFWKHQVLKEVRPNTNLLQSENDKIFK